MIMYPCFWRFYLRLPLHTMGNKAKRQGLCLIHIFAGAGIDVFEVEPPLDVNHPLLHSKNTIVTPHVAFASAESMEARCHIVFDNITKWLAGDQVNVIL